MVEDIRKIISNGFGTYTRNFNLYIPFVINAIMIGFLAILMLFVFTFVIFGDSLSSVDNPMNPEQMVTTFLQKINIHFSDIIVLSIVFILLLIFILSFFMGGAIGMTKQAIETGKSSLSTMIEAGKKNILNLFLAYILVSMIYLAGIVFIVPGAMKMNIVQVILQGDIGENPLLDIGILLWRLYDILLGLFLAVFSYAVVIDNLPPIDSIITSFKFFNKQKLDIFILSIISGGLLYIYLEITSRILMNHIFLWLLLNFFVVFFIIEPIITIWWVRLYMVRTDKKIYFDELLAHPNDLEKTGSY